MARGSFSTMLCLLMLAVALPGEAAAQEFLTPDEQAWLREHDGKIRVAPDPHYPPMEFFDQEGQFRGIAAEYLRLIEEKLGITFEIVRLSSFEEVLEKARTREIDMVNTVIQTPARSEYLHFTAPYISIPNVIVVGNGAGARIAIDDLKEMANVVYQGGYAIGPYLMETHGLVHLRPVTDPAEALRDLSMGRIQAMVGNLAVISHYVRSMNLPNLRIAGDCNFNDAISFASRNDWPMLHQILNKTLHEITLQEREAVKEEWIGLKYPKFQLDRRFWYGVLGAVASFVLVVAVLFAWNRILTRQVAAKIAEHRQAEEALADEAFRRHLLIEQSKDGIVVLNAEGKVHEVNKRFAEMLGYALDECEQLHVWDWDAQRSREELLEMLRQVDSSGDHFETLFRRGDGTTFAVEISTNGAVIKGKKYVFSVCRDISQRKQAEVEIKQKNEQLEKTLAEKDKFFSIIAHDLKSPLSGLLASTRLMVQNHDDLSREDVLKVSENMKQSAENLYNLLENLLEWSQVQRGLIGFAPRFCSLFDVVKRTMDVFYGAAREKNIALENAVSPDMVVYADESMLNSVLRNLLSNALKFSKRNGGVLVSAVRDGSVTRVMVQDQGIGMDRKTLAGIFALDQKTSQPGTEGEKGTGLGLILCREFVEKHGGRIWAESTGEQGTVLSFTLPAEEPKLPDRTAE